MSSHGKSSYSGKTQSAGVSWYNHVSRKFMIPYGIKKRDDYFEEKELLGIMKANTCDLLCRPSIGMSEFGEAVEMCLPLIKTLCRQIDLDDVIDKVHDRAQRQDGRHVDQNRRDGHVLVHDHQQHSPGTGADDESAGVRLHVSA